MSAPDPRQFYTRIQDVQQRFGGLTQTSQFMVQLGLAGGGFGDSVESHLFNSDVYDKLNGTSDHNFFCSDATLPGSTFDVMELQGARQGIIERIPNRRVYTDFDLTFYVDNQYKILRLFEEWMNYIDPIHSTTEVYTGSGKGMSGFGDNNCFYRLRYPNSYKRNIMVHKFERDIIRGKTMNRSSGDIKDKKDVNILTYIFLESFPLNIQAIPFAYDGSTITKVSVNFAYTRYMVCKNSGIGKSVKQFLSSLDPAGTQDDSTLGDAFSFPLGDLGLDVSSYIGDEYDFDTSIFGAGNTVDFSTAFGTQAWSDETIREVFLGPEFGNYSFTGRSSEPTREVQRVEPTSSAPSQSQSRANRESNETWSLDQINKNIEFLKTKPGGDIPAPPVREITPKRTYRKPTGSENPRNSSSLSSGFAEGGF